MRKKDFASGTGGIPPGTIHVWWASLPALLQDAAWIASRLDADERARCARIKAVHEGQRFAAGRAFAKEILCRYTHVPVQEIHFSYSIFGKPTFASSPFSLARTATDVFFAITSLHTLGLDCEDSVHSCLPRDPSSLLPFLHKNETELGMPLSWEDLLIMWVRKEAVVKACGYSMCAAQHICVSPRCEETRAFRFSADGDLLSLWQCPIVRHGSSVLACAYEEREAPVSLDLFRYPSS